MRGLLLIFFWEYKGRVDLVGVVLCTVVAIVVQQYAGAAAGASGHGREEGEQKMAATTPQGADDGKCEDET